MTSVDVLQASPLLTDLAGASGDHRSRGSSRRWWPGAICCGLYLVLAMVVFGHFDSLGSGHMAGNMSGDSIEEVWWLAWTAFAVPHGHDVFLAQWQNYPAGQNFGVNGSMLALGVLFMPITKVFGPIVSWNIAVRLALAVSASSMCFVLRRWVTWWPAAFVGGLLYGCSAYVLTSAGNYLFLTFVPLPPVFFLLLYEILVRQKWRPSRVGVLLGVVCCLQFFIWSEILIGMVLVGALATGLFLLVNRHRLQDGWRYAARAFVFAGAVGGVLLVLPAAFTLFGPQNTHGSPTQGLGDPFPSDLLGPIVPQFQWLSSRGLTAMASRHFASSSSEYVGIPMIVLLAGFALLLRKPKIMLFAGAMALIAFTLSLGSPLRIDGHATWLPLPWSVLSHLPLLGGYTPVRFSLFTALFAAAMFALGLDEARRRLRAADRLRISSPTLKAFAASCISLAVAAVVVLPLLPANTVSATPTNIPSFFTSASVDAIPEGGVVLSYPYPDIGNSDIFFQTPKTIMLDQSVSGMRFKLLGGFGWFPSTTGSHGQIAPLPLSPSSVQKIFDGAYWDASSETSLLSQGHATADLRTVLARYDVNAVIVQLRGAEPADVVRYVTATIGCPVYHRDVAVWLNVHRRLAEGVPGRDVNACAGGSTVISRFSSPFDGQKVSGRNVIISSATGFLTVVRVNYYLSSASERWKLIARGTQTQFGWVTQWNTKSVPNGSYVLRSVAVNDIGASSTSSPIAITVKN